MSNKVPSITSLTPKIQKLGYFLFVGQTFQCHSLIHPSTQSKYLNAIQSPPFNAKLSTKPTNLTLGKNSIFYPYPRYQKAENVLFTEIEEWRKQNPKLMFLTDRPIRETYPVNKKLSFADMFTKFWPQPPSPTQPSHCHRKPGFSGHFYQERILYAFENGLQHVLWFWEITLFFWNNKCILIEPYAPLRSQFKV